MRRPFTLEYWMDDGWFVGRLVEVPSVMSQGTTLDELRENIQDAYDVLITQDRPSVPKEARQEPVELEV